jgi:hypothetical protein
VVEDQLGEVETRGEVAEGEVNGRLDGGQPTDGSDSFVMCRSPCRLGIVAELIAVEPVADLLDRCSTQQRRNPQVLDGDMVDQGADVPFCAWSVQRPLISADLGDPAVELPTRSSEQRHDIHVPSSTPAAQNRWLAS